MTPEEAKRILALYRPGSADQDDPDFAEALDLADPGRNPEKRVAPVDPELSRWFRQHCASFQSVRAKFQEIQPPPALKDQILAEFKSHTTPIAPVRSRKPVMLAYAGCFLAVVTCLTVLLVRRAERDFTAYRQLVVSHALRPSYSMDIETTNISVITSVLKDNHAPADYQLPASLHAAQPVGCAVIAFHGKPTSMICFRSGKPLGPGEVADVWLFVAKQNDMLNAPASPSRAVTQIDRMAIATWSQGGEVFMLGVIGDQNVLQKYF